jgi:hypothetical protein
VKKFTILSTTERPTTDEYEAATREIEKHQNELVKIEIKEDEFFLPIVCHNMCRFAYDGVGYILILLHWPALFLRSSFF